MPCMKIAFRAHDISRKCVQKKIENLIKKKKVQIFRIVPEFRILRLTFIRKSNESQPQNTE